jgi:hypothetical protein
LELSSNSGLLKSNKLLQLIETKIGDKFNVQVGDWESVNMQADILLINVIVASHKMLTVASTIGAKLALSTA